MTPQEKAIRAYEEAQNRKLSLPIVDHEKEYCDTKAIADAIMVCLGILFIFILLFLVEPFSEGFFHDL
tara:strand:+ start:168 stop:371 length:204 start_codon:yes stop_codon:yes gene_type:complete